MVYKTIQFCGPRRGQRPRSPGLGNKMRRAPEQRFLQIYGVMSETSFGGRIGKGRREGRDMAEVREFTEADALSKELSSTFSCSRSSCIIVMM
jgi:hypothetical protein